MKKPEAVFFDWDGTLVDTFDLLYAANGHVMRAMGKEQISKTLYKERMLLSTRDLYPKLFKDRAEEAMGYLYDYIEKNHISALKKMVGAEALLSRLYNDGVVLGVVSNKKQLYLEKEIRYLKWEKYFENRVVGAGVAKKDKPAPDPVIFICNITNIKPDNDSIWFVGDTETDVQAASKSACFPVLLSGSGAVDFSLDDYCPMIVLKNCNDLSKYYQKTVAVP